MVHISDWLPTFAKITGVSIDHSIDGKNVWNALSDDLENPRRELLVHYDQVTPYKAYVADNYKLVSGTTSEGAYDGWLSKPIESAEQNTTFGAHYSDAILSSRAGQILKKYSKTQVRNGNGFISNDEIEEIRLKARVTCNGHEPPANNSDQACNPLASPCLFDILDDPCETKNLAKQFPEIVKRLEATLDYYSHVAQPSRKRPSDPRSDPANFGGVWTWWYDELNITTEPNSSGMEKPDQVNFKRETIMNSIWVSMSCIHSCAVCFEVNPSILSISDLYCYKKRVNFLASIKQSEQCIRQ